jgi:predicted transcriptional regulator of viral defense system
MGWAAQFFADHPAFSFQQFRHEHRRLCSTNYQSTQSAQTYWVNEGVLVRVQPGLYAVAASVTERAFPLVLASVATSDAVLAMHTAIRVHLNWDDYPAYWPRFYFTQSRQKPFAFNEELFEPVRVTQTDALDAELVSVGKFSVKVSSLNCAVLDALDRLSTLGWAKTWSTLAMIPRQRLDVSDLVGRAVIRGNAVLAAKLGFFLEQHRNRLFVGEDQLDRLRRRAPKSARSTVKDLRGGRVVNGWNIIVPEEVWLGDFSESDRLEIWRE